MPKARVLITTAKDEEQVILYSFASSGVGWDMCRTIRLRLEKEGTICQVSLGPSVKLVLINYQVLLDSGKSSPLMFTIILINAVIPNAFETRGKHCTGD